MSGLLIARPGRCVRCASGVPVGAPFCPQCGWSQSGHLVEAEQPTSPGPAPAPAGRRFGAWVVDAVLRALVVAVVAVVAVQLVAGSAAWVILIPLVSAAAAEVVFAWLRGSGGSPGQHALGLALLRDDSVRRAGFWRSIARDVVYGLSSCILVGPFSPLFRTDRRGWHDLASGTRLVERAHSSSNPVTDSKQVLTAPTTPLEIARPVGPTRADHVTDDQSDGSARLLVFTGGPAVHLSRSALIGRDPTADRSVERVIALKNGDRSVSKTHALIEVSGELIFVTDLWSTNGSRVQAGGSLVPLQPGVRTPIAPDARLQFGDQRADLRPVPARRG